MSLIQQHFLSVYRDPLASTLFEEVYRRYSEPHRHYHNFQHLETGLRDWLSLFGAIEPQDFLAWMYHDVVYDPRSDRNEGDSAGLFMDHARQLRLSLEFAEPVALGILQTAYAGSLTTIGSKVTDIDLLVLGKAWETYQVYAGNIRKEYDFLPDEAFRAGRISVLGKLLDRPWIYFSGKVRDQYEVQARDNMAREIDELRRV